MIDNKDDLQRKRNQLLTFRDDKEGGCWDEESSELRKEARKLIFQWIVLETEENLGNNEPPTSSPY